MNIKNMRFMFMLFLIGFSFYANSAFRALTGAVSCEIMGKSDTVDFPGVKLTVRYIDDNNIHWQTNKKEAYKTISYAKLAPHIHFLNWIEQDGMTVSHIVDCASNTV